MTVLVFVDTNIFVYAHQANERTKQPLALKWLEQLWREQLGRTSMQVLNEYYVTLTRKIRPACPPADAWDEVRNLGAWHPQSTDLDLLLRSREIEQRYRLSWWDSLSVAAAQLQNCTLLLSEDLQDGATYGTVTIRNPFRLSVAEAMATYPAAPLVAPKHRRRGRPRVASRRTPSRHSSAL